jgi:hypothetical protein
MTFNSEKKQVTFFFKKKKKGTRKPNVFNLFFLRVSHISQLIFLTVI